MRHINYTYYSVTSDGKLYHDGIVVDIVPRSKDNFWIYDIEDDSCIIQLKDTDYAVVTMRYNPADINYNVSFYYNLATSYDIAIIKDYIMKYVSNCKDDFISAIALDEQFNEIKEYSELFKYNDTEKGLVVISTSPDNWLKLYEVTNNSLIVPAILSAGVNFLAMVNIGKEIVKNNL